MGWNNQIVNLIIVVQEVSGQSGIFGYSPTVGPGNLTFSLTVAGGTDPYGNTYFAGLTVYFPGGSRERMFSGTYTAAAFDGNPSGSYDGTWFEMLPNDTPGATHYPGALGAQSSPFVNDPVYLAIFSPFTSSILNNRQSAILLAEQNSDATNGEQIYMFAGTINLDTSGAAHGKKIKLKGDVVVTPATAAGLTIVPGGAAVVGTNTLNGTPIYNGANFGVTVGSWQPIGTVPFAPFLNGFKDRALGGNFPAPEYFVDAFGNVELRGTITGINVAPGPSNIGLPVLNMPQGLRPSKTKMCEIAANNGGEVSGRVDIEPGGNLTWRGPTVVTGGVNWFTINITYKAEL